MFHFRLLYQVELKTKEIVERYDSIKSAVETNEGFVYASLRNAICYKKPYKGYFWYWKENVIDY